MKSLIKKFTWVLPVAVLLFACIDNDKKKDATEVTVVETSKTKILDI